MKPNKPIILYIPTLFVEELQKYLIANKPNFKYDINYFYYIVHYIIRKQIIHKNKEFVSFSKNLISVTISNINNYVKILKNGEFIKSDNLYIKGKKSLGYCINPIYLKGITIIELNKDSLLFDRIVKNQRKKTNHNNRLEPFLKQMRDVFIKTELDYQEAEKWILSQSDEVKITSYMIALNQLKDKRFRYFNRNKTNNRLDTNLTNLKSELKQFIIGDYVNIDLKNSQPFFLSMLLESINNIKQQGNLPLCYYLSYKNIVKPFGIKRINNILKICQNQKKSFLANLKSFNTSVINGDLYDDFIKNYSNEITRKEVKNIMFKVLFSKNTMSDKYKNFIPYDKEKKVFATVYPLVYESIKSLKEKDNTLLPIFLQKIESYIFIDCIAKELVINGIVPLTVHDSVIVKSEYKEKTIEIMNKIFMQKFNVIPTFKAKPLIEK